MELRHLTASLVALAAVAGPIAGCGGSDNGKSTGSSGGSPQPVRSSGSSQPSGGSSKITISDFKFKPASLTVGKGVQVTVANQDSTAHTLTADSGNAFDTNDIDPGSSKTFMVSKAGSYSYHCEIHPFMKGTLVVR